MTKSYSETHGEILGKLLYKMREKKETEVVPIQESDELVCRPGVRGQEIR